MAISNISKENFIKYIDKLKELRQIEDDLNSAGRKLEDFCISFADHEQLIIDILTDAFDDDASGWISYFIYDLSFGAVWYDWYEGCATEKDGVDIPLGNVSDLYDLLISEMGK